MSIEIEFQQVNAGPIVENQVSNVEDAALRKYEDDAALAILAHDFEAADADAGIKNLTQEWTTADILYQSPSNTQQFYNPVRANVPRFTLSNIVDVVVPKIHGAIFFDTPAFMLRPNPKIEQR